MPQAEDNASPEDPHNPDSRHNRHKHGGAAPDMWHCTRYVAVHPLRGGAPEQKRCIAYGSGAVPQHTRTNAELAHRTTHRRTPSCAAGPYWWQDGHAAHATTCTPAHSDTSHTLTCEEPQNPPLCLGVKVAAVRGARPVGVKVAAVPGGGGRACCLGATPLHARTRHGGIAALEVRHAADMPIAGF